MDSIKILKTQIYNDSRGFFLESYNQKEWDDIKFIQDNISISKFGVVRGLHYQLNNPQGKLVRVLSGRIFDVVVDIRVGSPTFGQWKGFYLFSISDQLWVPPGFAHGFSVHSENATVLYKCTDYYCSADSYIINVNDPNINIRWDCTKPIISERDMCAPYLKNIDNENLPKYIKD